MNNRRLLYGSAILIVSLMLISPNLVNSVMANGPAVVYSETFYGRVNARFTESLGHQYYTGTGWAMAYITVTVYEDNTVQLVFNFPFWTEVYYGKIRRMVNTTFYMFIAASQTTMGEGMDKVRMFIMITPSGLNLVLSYIVVDYGGMMSPQYISVNGDGGGPYILTYQYRFRGTYSAGD